MSRSLLKNLALLAFLGILAGGAYWVWEHYYRAATESSAQKKPEEAIPANIAVAETKDFPVYLDSLGNVQAWNTVTVRSRVDGQIDKIAFDEGQFIKAGDLMVQLDPRPFQATLDQAVAKKAQDEANLANMQRDLERFEKVGTLANTQQQIDTQRSAVTQQQALIKSDAGAIDNAKVQLIYTTIKAPIAGRIGFRLVDQGNIIHAADTGGVATITQIEPIAVIFTEPEEELPRILDELKGGTLAVVAYTSDGKRELGKGKLSLVDNQVDMTTGSIKLKGEFPNKDHTLWPGLSVATRLLITTEKNVVVVPDAAVQRGPDNLFAYVANADNRIERRNLVVSEIQDGEAVIKSGLNAGEKVVTSGYYRLQPGSLIDTSQQKKEKENAARTTASDSGSQIKQSSREVE